jgi:hypothetical protein
MIAINSVNFGFLKADSPQLVRLGALAEHYFQDDLNTCLIKLRQFGGLLAQTTAARCGAFASPAEPQPDLLRRLKFERILPGETGDLFHQLSTEMPLHVSCCVTKIRRESRKSRNQGTCRAALSPSESKPKFARVLVVDTSPLHAITLTTERSSAIPRAALMCMGGNLSVWLDIQGACRYS